MIILAIILLHLISVWVFRIYETKAMVNVHFKQIQEEGYITENIKKSMLNSADDIFGTAFEFEVSGTSEEVDEGDIVHLELRVIPRNKYLRFMDFKVTRTGRHKYQITD